MLASDPTVTYAPDPSSGAVRVDGKSSDKLSRAPAPVETSPMMDPIAAITSYLDASRRVMDIWRYTIRAQQDATLAFWRSQLQLALRTIAAPPLDIAKRHD